MVRQVPYRAVAARALADWRRFERAAAQADPGTAAWRAAIDAAASAKQRYTSAVDGAIAEQLSEPPPEIPVAPADAGDET